MSRRAGNSNRKTELEKLKYLRQSGESRLNHYEFKDERLFEEVSELENLSAQNKATDLDDFVEDDDGQGYVDYGLDDGHDDYDDYESDADEPKGKRGRKGDGKEARTKKVKPEARPEAQGVDDDVLLSEIFGSIDAEAGVSTTEPSQSAIDGMATKTSFDAKKSFASVRSNSELLEPISRSTRTDPTNAGASESIEHLESSEMQIDTKEGNLDMAVKENVTAEDLAADDDQQNAVETEKEKHIQNPSTHISYAVRKIQRADTTSANKTSGPFLPKFDKHFPAGGTTSSATSFPRNNFVESLAQPLSNFDEADFLQEDGSLRVYWFDCFDHNGTIYLFGKVFHKRDKKHITCCISVQNMKRVLFLLPGRKNLSDGAPFFTTDEVRDEFNDVRKKYGVDEFASRRVVRKYAFELPGIPTESEYLKVVYSYKYPALPEGTHGKTFSHVFGSHTSALENFLIKRKLMVNNAVVFVFENTQVSWTKLEFEVKDPKNVKVLSDESQGNMPPPTFCVMSLSFQTVLNHAKNSHEIVAFSAVISTDASIEKMSTERNTQSVNAVRQLTDVPIPAGFGDAVKRNRDVVGSIEVLTTEKALLNYLLAIIHRSDPDVFVGHNLLSVDLHTILHRMKANKVEFWSKIGRLRRSKWPKMNSGSRAAEFQLQDRSLTAGRIVCDTFMSCREYVLKAKSFTLSNMANMLLGVDREDIDIDKVPQMFWNAEHLMSLIAHTEKDSVLVTNIMFKLQLLALSKQLTTLAGNLWCRTILAGSRADRNEYLLLHEFHNKKFIVPDKTYRKSSNAIEIQKDEDDDGPGNAPTSSSRKKPTFSGGLVLEPKSGFYDKFVLLLDFNSLYPSIIQEFNICFTTVARNSLNNDDAPETPGPDSPQGLLPKLLATLVERRRAVKSLMKNQKLSDSERSELDIRQQALKLTANSMYGCLGFAHSRFYAKPIAMLVTQKGREILQATVDLAGSEGLDVIYGDTDSIMIYTNSTDLKDVNKIGNEFKKSVNRRYKLLEIEMDGVFKKMLLLKKKKYAALVVEEKAGHQVARLEKKGLDIVRRDWEDVISLIQEHLSSISEKVRNNEIPVAKFVINKGLTKNPEDYADLKNQPHAQVALAMRKKGLRVNVGDTVPYVIVTGTDHGLASRAQHPDEVTREGSEYKLDVEYYLANQVLPPIGRLLNPLNEITQDQIAGWLSLDVTKFKATNSASFDDQENSLLFEGCLSEKIISPNIDTFKIACHCCDHSFEFDLAHAQVSENMEGLVCPKCSTIIEFCHIKSQVLLFLRRHIRQFKYFYCGCDENTCAIQSRRLTVFARRCQMPGCKGSLNRMIGNAALASQLRYLVSMLDFQKFSVNEKVTATTLTAGKCAAGLKEVFDAMTNYKTRNAFYNVSLQSLFENMGLSASSLV
ncbi:DNA polymerase alpha catalytic subunit [Blyttiomyces sp. JEL0837]|nr:DNA polymerase alpha catalytic subunit [Blyttiomyces sp. JEL0837]